MHSTGSWPEGVWQCPQRAGGKTKKTDFSQRCDEIRLLVSDSSCSVCTQMYKLFSHGVVFQAVRGMLDNHNEPVSDLSYFDCIESVMENSKVGLSNGRSVQTRSAERLLTPRRLFRSSVNPWQGFPRTVRPGTCRPSETVWDRRPRLCVASLKQQDRCTGRPRAPSHNLLFSILNHI